MSSQPQVLDEGHLDPVLRAVTQADSTRRKKQMIAFGILTEVAGADRMKVV
jgi:hypothetical protein